MKKFIIFIIIFVLISVGSFYFYIKHTATTNANNFFNKLKSYEPKVSILKTGTFIDFSSSEKPIKNKNISEGIIFKDVDNNISLISNLKVNGLYCSLDNDKFNCSIFNDKDTKVNAPQIYDEYNIGVAVTLKDDSKWHVIHESNKYSKYVTLISDTKIDVNNDGNKIDIGIIEDPDHIPFDKNGSKLYDVKSESNIGYYIENVYRPTLKSLSNIFEVRLIEYNELNALKEAINFKRLSSREVDIMTDTSYEILDSIGWHTESPRPVYKLSSIKLTNEQYEKLTPHWLFNELSGNYWVNCKGHKVKTAIWYGEGYTTPRPTTGYSLKPVMTIDKSNIK